MSKIGALADGMRDRQGLIAGCAPGQTRRENPVLFCWIRIRIFWWYSIEYLGSSTYQPKPRVNTISNCI